MGRWTRLRDATALRWERKIGTDFSSPYIKAGGWVWFSFGEQSLVFRSPPPTPPRSCMEARGWRGGPAQDRTPPRPGPARGSPGCALWPRRITAASRAPARHHSAGASQPSPPGKPRTRGRSRASLGASETGGRVTPGAPARGTHLAAGRGRRPEDMNARGPQSRQTGATSSNTSCSDVTGHVGRGLKGAAGPAFPTAPPRPVTNPGENGPVRFNGATST